ncbi:hypothetical protein NA56DRAFT_659457 [Hyaloscypha hepaticicola]|uniref:Uncharacterized protein n=1 Tax=Hyaloscypha hepaticicola TaxID=2082293 RepID=A0A2J6Q3W7_9HELO|nr:hypothetical protein NA56DRAFT_659457 [Hyaloscypha hepaticicola]
MTIGEAVAGPTHAHMHRHFHEKKDAAPVNWDTLDWNAMGIDWTSAWAAGQKTATSAPAPAATPVTTAAPQAPTAAAAPAPTTTHAPSGGVFEQVVSNAASALFAGLDGIADAFTAFGTATVGSGSEVSYIGNIGKPQGSNMIKVATTAGYAFTALFKNTSGGPMKVVIWNKAYSLTGNAADAQANLGASLAPKTPILVLPLDAGDSQIVAFQENSQIGFAQATDAIAASGAYAITWGECNFVPTGSGYDVSAIMNVNGNNYDMTITSAEAPDCTSSRTQNMWLTPTDPVGNSDGSCYIAQSTATLTIEMGGTI